MGSLINMGCKFTGESDSENITKSVENSQTQSYRHEFGVSVFGTRRTSNDSRLRF